MMRPFLSGLMVLALALPAGAQTASTAGLTTLRVVLLMRHGVRSPTHEPALSPAIAPDPWPAWPVAPGYLTPHGAQAISILGAYDRALFAAQGLLPAAGCPAAGTVLIYADVDERTVKTGEAYADGLAPGCGIVTQHAATKEDPLFSSLDGAGPFDAGKAKAAMLAVAGGDLNHIVAAHAALFDAMQAALDPGGSAFLDLPARLSIQQPDDLPKLSGPVDEGSSAAEDFLLEYLDDKPMTQVGWGRVSPAQVPALLALHPLAYTLTARPDYIAARAGAPLATRVAAALRAGPAVTVLVGHDTNIARLGGFLHLHWALSGYPADDPPPGGALVFTLLRDSRNGAQYVAVSYQVQTMSQIRELMPLTLTTPPAAESLPIPNCGDSIALTACPLDRFLLLANAGPSSP
jgi:4-phytase/acid phosphatase